MYGQTEQSFVMEKPFGPFGIEQPTSSWCNLCYEITSVSLTILNCINPFSQNWGIGLECQKKSYSDLRKLHSCKPIKTGKKIRNCFLFAMLMISKDMLSNTICDSFPSSDS